MFEPGSASHPSALATPRTKAARRESPAVTASPRTSGTTRPAAAGREPSLMDGRHTWTDAQLRTEAQRVATQLSQAGVRVLATLLDNSVAWVVADRAAELAGAVHVPLPTSLTRTQLALALRSTAADAWLTTPAVAHHLRTTLPARMDATEPAHEVRRCEIAGDLLALLVPQPGATQARSPYDTDPRPGLAAMQGVADGLVRATALLGITRHLCVLPLAEPLERVAGLRAAMARGADCIVLPLHQVGLTGAASFDPAVFHAAVARLEPHSMVLRPALLRAWSAHLHATRRSAPRSLQLVVVAGPAVSERALMEAHAAGIPAYEGYGPSQGGLLQTLNLPGADLPGSAGRALPHARLRCTADGEIEVAESQLPIPVWRPTGDLGHIDAQGFLHVTGRAADGVPPDAAAPGHPVPADWAAATLRGGPGLIQARPAEHS